ncbi:uncharacterized protein LOC110809137 [Carica papaya]|uniref:uncharacterized protein LOC110809137 n=1 Tax=Carica papaya TaxID=3649 RepID=UPI000B8CB26E|nr:uncharacterized protein LOC110809137 [Carica papaya]
MEAEEANSGHGLVHLKCSYNNKYWVRSSKEELWIIAKADQPNEDQSKWSCTLFKPIFETGNHYGQVKFLHVQLGHYVCHSKETEPYNSCLLAESEDPRNDLSDIFNYTDLGAMFMLPRYVAFKGNNQKYLTRGLRDDGISEYLQFKSKQKGGFPYVTHRVYQLFDGSVRIQYGGFWRRDPNWIKHDGDDNTTNPNLKFWPVKVNENVVALRSLANNRYCKRLTKDYKKDCLNAAVSTITSEAKMEVSEVTVSRKIYNVNYHFRDARIYELSSFIAASGVYYNETKESVEAEVNLSFTDTRSYSWNSIITSKLNVPTTIKATIPVINNKTIQIVGSFDGPYEWGDINENSNDMEITYKVRVPPLCEMSVNLFGTEVACDIPFSYVQHDNLINDRQDTYDMHDGLYTGITNIYNFNYDIAKYL